jgi:hypothetical protein
MRLKVCGIFAKDIFHLHKKMGINEMIFEVGSIAHNILNQCLLSKIKVCIKKS